MSLSTSPHDQIQSPHPLSREHVYSGARMIMGSGYHVHEYVEHLPVHMHMLRQLQNKWYSSCATYGYAQGKRSLQSRQLESLSAW